MPRVISLIVLLAIILLVGAVFFQVMAQFLVPLFLACVLLIVFHPLHAWILEKMPRRPRLAALLTTIAIMLAVLVPLAWLIWNAYFEAQHAVEWVQSAEGSALIKRGFTTVSDWIDRITNHRFELPKIEELLQKAPDFAAPYLLSSLQSFVGMLIGSMIMIIALYFFLADGPIMVKALMQLSPLEEAHEYELLARFSQISRSVVVATLLSAVVQGIAAGVGYYFVLPRDAPIFLLTALTMVFAIVPLVGAFGIWGLVCAYLFLLGNAEGQPIGSNWLLVVGFATYCIVVVSGLDNVIKPYVLHGQANLHPLLALLSILGGVKVLGPIGIIVGPMLVSFLQALLSIFQRQVEGWDDPTKKPLEKLSPAAEALAESIEAAVNTVEELAEEKQAAKPAATKTAKAAKTGRTRNRRRKR